MVIKTRSEAKPGYTLIDAIIAKYNVQPGAVIPILQEIQEAFGFVPQFAIQRISESIKIPDSEIYGIVTFYSQFRLEPVGKNIIKVCHGTACHLNGAEKVATAIAQITGAEEGQTSKDGDFTVEKVACLGCCSLAPCIMCNNEIHGRLSYEGIEKIVKQLKESESSIRTE